MQRRAAAVSAVIFLLVAAGAYSFVGVVEQPSVDVDELDPEHSLSGGETLTVGGTEYAVTEVGEDGAELEWTNESARYTETIENDSTVSAAAVAWAGQTNRDTATLADGEVIDSQGAEFRVEVDGETVVLNATGEEDTEEFEDGDSLVYRDTETTVTAVTADEVRLAWGDPYHVRTDDGLQFRQQINVSRVLQADESVENTVLSTDDERFVRYRNGSTEPLAAYLPDPEEETFAVGETLRYQNQTMTVASVGDTATLEWFAPRTNTLSPGEGDEVSFGGTTYVAHIADGQLHLTEDIAAYESQQQRLEGFEERVAGIWAVAIVAALAGVLTVGLAYLPSRY